MDEDYPRHVSTTITLVYIATITIWILILSIILYLEFSIVYLFVGTIPLLAPILICYNSSDLSLADDKEMVRYGTLPIGLILGVALLQAMASNFKGNERLLSGLIFGAIVTTVLGIPDYYFGSDYMPVTRHIRSAIQCLSAGFFLMALTVYFINRMTTKWN